MRRTPGARIEYRTREWEREYVIIWSRDSGKTFRKYRFYTIYACVRFETGFQTRKARKPSKRNSYTTLEWVPRYYHPRVTLSENVVTREIQTFYTEERAKKNSVFKITHIWLRWVICFKTESIVISNFKNNVQSL